MVFDFRKDKLNPIIVCECGCGNFKFLYDKNGRISYILQGHATGARSKGKKATIETKLKLSKIRRGKPKTQEWKKKIGDAQRGPLNHLYGKPSPYKGMKNRYTPLQIERIRQGRLRQVIPIKDTKIEKMMQLALSLEQIKFETHKAIIGQPDIFIEPNTCIFIDGCYWHGCRECYPDLIVNKRIFQTTFKDVDVNQKLNELGYNVIRIKEHVIMDEKTDSMLNIMSLIKKTIFQIRNKS